MPDLQSVLVTGDKDVVVVRANRSGSRECPDCQTLSQSRKGGYIRRLQDLPVQSVAVRIEVQVTRWRCRNQECARRSFVEQLQQSALPFARRTRRVSELAHLLGHAVGGLPAQRLLRRLAMPQSDDTVLRSLRREAAKRKKLAVRVVGIDDWSWQQGRSYGTIMVDLERREVVDVLHHVLHVAKLTPKRKYSQTA